MGLSANLVLMVGLSLFSSSVEANRCSPELALASPNNEGENLQQVGYERGIRYLENGQIKVSYQKPGGLLEEVVYDRYDPAHDVFQQITQVNDGSIVSITKDFSRGEGKKTDTRIEFHILNNYRPEYSHHVDSPIPTFILVEKEDATPLVFPRPGVVIPDPHGRRKMTKLDDNDALDVDSNGELKIRIPYPGKAAAIGTHGCNIDGSLSGLSNDDVIRLAIWLKGRGFDTVAIVSCHQNVRSPSGTTTRSKTFKDLASQLRKQRPQNLPRIVIAQPGAVGELNIVPTGEGEQRIIGREDPYGEVVHVDSDGVVRRYKPVEFSQQIWPGR